MGVFVRLSCPRRCSCFPGSHWSTIRVAFGIIASTVLDIPGCRARIAVIRIWAFLYQCILHVCLYITSRTLGIFGTQGCSRSELLGSAVTDFGADHRSVLLFGLLEPRIFYRISSGFNCTFTLGLVKPCCCAMRVPIREAQLSDDETKCCRQACVLQLK